MKLSDFLNRVRTFKKIPLYLDIETLQFNERNGYQRPSDFKNQVFSVAVSFWFEGKLYVDHFPNFFEFFQEIELNRLKKSLVIELLIHNGNKYDNHYMLNQLLHLYPNIRRLPAYLKNAENNDFTATYNTLKKKKVVRFVIEKRVKSKSNVELDFTLGSVRYKTVDTLPKSGGMSLKNIGDALVRNKIMPSEYHKLGDFDYLKHNRDEDMTYDQSVDYALHVWRGLTPREFEYIDNDVLILGYFHKYYSQLFPGFDFNKITFSQNVMEEYLINFLAKFQLKGKYGNLDISYSNYKFRKINYFDYLKRFYKGGLNIYNDRKVGQHLKGNFVSFDRNSSYPHSMYEGNIPTILDHFSERPSKIKYGQLDLNYFYLFEITIDEFNRIIKNVSSKTVKKALVKYYGSYHDNRYINSYTLKLIQNFTSKPLTELNYISYNRFYCYPFGARKVISDNYFTKTQGKARYVLNYQSPLHIRLTDKPNKNKYLPSEIASSKIILNGIYGLPALRPFYNLFKYNPKTENIESYPEGYQNTERNVLFSVFVTAMSFYNLLDPLKFLSGDEIDEWHFYSDTDSHYMDARALEKIPDSYIDQMDLGDWKIEHRISDFYILNHKKYAFYAKDEKRIIVHSGGVPLSSFDTSVPFEDFVNNQFHDGATVTSTRNILTNMGTMAIYNAEINLSKGKQYPEEASLLNSIALQEIADQLKIEMLDFSNDNQLIYIETPFGTLSESEIYQKEKPADGHDLSYLADLENGLIKPEIEKLVL